MRRTRVGHEGHAVQVAPRLTLARLRPRRRRLERRREEITSSPESVTLDGVRRWERAMRRLIDDERRAKVEARTAACGARTRAGTACLAPPVKVDGIAKNGRCKLHGGLSAGGRR